MRHEEGSPEQAPHRIVVSPNDSLGSRGRVIFFLVVALAVLLVSASVAARGLWPVLPFAGLELLVLAICLYVVERRTRYREVITLEGDSLRVEQGRGRPETEQRFHRAWVRVELEPAAHRNYPARLFLREGHRQCEIGRCLTESERSSLGERLRGLLATGK